MAYCTIKTALIQENDLVCFFVQDFTAEGKECQISGFGLLSSGGIQTKTLQVTRVKVHEAEACHKMYWDPEHNPPIKHTQIFREDKMLCAGGGDKDACQVRP